MLSQEEKKYQDFIRKFQHSVLDVQNDFYKLSDDNKERAKQYILSLAKTQVEVEIMLSIMKRL